MYYNFIRLFLLFVFLLAAIGSTAYLFFFHQPVFALANIVLVAMAFPTAKKIFKEFTK